ncbi:MAG TPA: type I 3-dehydroquinate dehydratase [Pyrinomonadaceae bacterium]|nr:type I 3-dehydroquinate dehydratase [Pyrinomonadaceae bacterium]
MTRASLIANLSTPLSADGRELRALPPSVEFVELRAGLVDPEWVSQHFSGQILYELKVEDDLNEDVLNRIPVEQRIVSWYGEASNLAELQARFSEVSAIPARFYKLVNKARTISEEFLPLQLLKSLGRTDTIAYAKGSLGFWTRLAALQLGAPAIFGLASPSPDASEPTIAKLIDDYGLPEVHPVKELFAIIGKPIFHSLSPRLHNASYHAMNYPALFVPLQVESFSDFWREFVLSKQLDVLGFPINGMTVGSPHKEEAFITARNISSMVRQTQAANILVRNNGWWNADTTDPDVIYAANQQNLSVHDKRAAVIGCGGAGRAMAAALAASGASVTLINRGTERGEYAASLLGLPYKPLLDFDAEGYDIVVNATPVGRDTDEAPFKLERLNSDAVVIDLVYGSRPTPLIDSTHAHHQVAIDGRDVLVTQVRNQFRLMTGKEMSAALAFEVLGRLSSNGKH